MKATEEQIKARAFELLYKVTPILAEESRQEAENEFKKKVMLTDNQKHILKRKIGDLTLATGHKYYAILFIKHETDFGIDKFTRLLYNDTTGNHSDEIHGVFVSFIDEFLEWNELYQLNELWGEEPKKVWQEVKDWGI